ncbi:MAG: hypothetical protein IT258_12695 [Saprospiraceae bacterium]|nr:hypothetical protein [Saprospiraceae bacterium]
MRPSSTLGFAFLLCLLLGCTRTLYVPNAIHTPLMSKKGDYSVNLNMRPVAPFNSELQTAYAPIDHLGLMANGSIMGYKSANNESAFKHHLLEAGIGTFGSFWENNCHQKIMRAECYLGTGFGRASVVDDYPGFFSSDTTVYTYEGNYRRTFLQVGLGVRLKMVELSLATRFANVYFPRFTDYANGIRTATGDYEFYTYEPAIRAAIGYKQLKFSLQLGFVESLTQDASDFNNATGNAWGNIHFNGSIQVSTFLEDCPEAPPISFGGAATEPDGNRLPTVLRLYSPTPTICLLAVDSKSDGSVCSLSLNGAPLLENARLSQDPICVETNLLRNTENILLLKCNSVAESNSSTLKIILKEGKLEREFYLKATAGSTEELKLVVQE